MTIQEFQQRTNVIVTNNEFNAINTMYMMSDLDKDAFCKMWKCTNRNFIATRRRQLANAQAFNALKRQLKPFYRKTITISIEKAFWYPSMLLDEELEMLQAAGINPNQTIDQLRCAVGNFVNTPDALL